jgi:hypothetical protein
MVAAQAPVSRDFCRDARGGWVCVVVSKGVSRPSEDGFEVGRCVRRWWQIGTKCARLVHHAPFDVRACSRTQDVRLCVCACVTTRGARHCAHNACASARVTCGAPPVREEDGVGACAAWLVEGVRLQMDKVALSSRTVIQHETIRDNVRSALVGSTRTGSEQRRKFSCKHTWQRKTV